MIENQAAIQICREMRVSLRSGGVVIVRETPDRQTLRLITPGSTTDLTSAEASALASMTYRLDVERLPAEPVVEPGEVSADRLLMLEAVALIQGRTLAVGDDYSMVCDLCGGESLALGADHPDIGPDGVDLLGVAESVIHRDDCRGERICRALRREIDRDVGGVSRAREVGDL